MTNTRDRDLVVEVHEYEVTLASHNELHAGIVAGEHRKYLVACTDSWDGYQAAIDIAWRAGDREVTSCRWVP